MAGLNDDVIIGDATYKLIGNIKGEKGDTGDPGNYIKIEDNGESVSVTNISDGSIINSLSNLGGENNKGFRGITGENGNNANIQFAIDDNGNLCYRVVHASQGI